MQQLARRRAAEYQQGGRQGRRRSVIISRIFNDWHRYNIQNALLFALWLRSGMQVGMAEQGYYVAVHLFGQGAWNAAEPIAVAAALADQPALAASVV